MDIEKKDLTRSAATSEDDFRQGASDADELIVDAASATRNFVEQVRARLMGLSTRADEQWLRTGVVSPATSGSGPWVISYAIRRDPAAWVRHLTSEAFHIWTFRAPTRPKRKIQLPPAIQFVDPGRAVDFLEDHPELDAPITDAYSKLSVLFGTDRFLLKKEDSPESSDPADASLILAVQTPLSASDAADRLDRFDSDWWLEVSPAVRRLVVVTVEFV